MAWISDKGSPTGLVTSSVNTIRKPIPGPGEASKDMKNNGWTVRAASGMIQVFTKNLGWIPIH